MQTDFVDYYELLEVSPNASTAAIERMFRYKAKACHPDVAGDAGRSQFQRLAQALEALRDPARRASYDQFYEREKENKISLAKNANAAPNDQQERYKLLSLLYAKRRRDQKSPGIGLGTLETMVAFPIPVLEFHLWYFREKGWIQRESSGHLSITADGVDQIDNMTQQLERNRVPRLEHQNRRIAKRNETITA